MKSQRQTQVLLVDDEPIILTTVGAALRQAGFTLMAVGNSTDASAYLQEMRPDVIVTDISMEGLSGRDLLAQAKALDPDVTVIVISGYCDVGSAIETLRLGAEDYLSKPFDFEELLLRVARCAELRDLRSRVRLYEALFPVCPVCQRIGDDQGRHEANGVRRSREDAPPRTVFATSGEMPCPACASRSKHD